jgi:alpha-tubulin suppressor-like RCC1 family protein
MIYPRTTMKRLHLVLLFAAFLVGVARSQTPVTYVGSTGETFALYAYEGERTALLVDSTSYDPAILRRMLTQMDYFWQAFVEATGRQPTPYKTYNSKPTLAVLKTDKLGGAAVGYVGATGVEFGKGRFDTWYGSIASSPYDNDFLFAYEFGRNFYFYTGKFDSSELKSGNQDASRIFGAFVYYPTIFSWLNQQKTPFDTYKWTETFYYYNEIRQVAVNFMEDTSVSYDQVFLQGVYFPMNRLQQGAGLVLQGLLFWLQEAYPDTLKSNLYKEATQLSASVSAQDVIDNYLIAASRAVSVDLSWVFENQFRLPVSQKAKTSLTGLPKRQTAIAISQTRRIPSSANRLIDPHASFANGRVEWYIADWYLPPTMPTTTDRNPITGSTAIKVTSFNPQTFSDPYANVILRTIPVASSDQNARLYKMSGWMRGRNLSVARGYNNLPWMVVLFLYSNDLGGWLQYMPFAGIKGSASENWSFDWVYFEAYGGRTRFNGQAEVQFDLRVYCREGEVWISDLNVEEIEGITPPPVPKTYKEPSDVHARLGESVTLTYGVASEKFVGYAWYKDGVRLMGTGTTSYSIPSVTAEDAGEYYCVATASSGEVRSRTVTLSVDSLGVPSIATQPTGLTLTAGQSGTLSVTANGTAPLSYQWYKGLSPIAGATSGTYSIPSAQLANTGRYWVSVSNSVGTVKSNTAGSVFAGLGDRSFYLKADGSLWGMGSNENGELGNGSTANTSTAVQVAANVRTVASGLGHTLFVDVNGILWATGLNSVGQLGDGTTTDRSSPVRVAVDVVAVAAGNYHSLFVTSDGSLWAMGSNWNGETAGAGGATPRVIARGVSAVAAGADHSVFLKKDGTAWAVGANSRGQLGDGSLTKRTAPVQVGTGVSAIAANGYHSLFLKSDGSLWGVGNNADGELADGTIINHSTPIQMASDVSRIAAGKQHSMWVKRDGSLWTAGINSAGGLGDGTKTSRTSAVQVASNVADIAGGPLHSLFVKTDGTLWAVGRNHLGQLGTNNSADVPAPLQIASNIGAGVQLTVLPNDIEFTVSPPPLTFLVEGEDLRLAAATYGVVNSYRWRRNGTVVPGANGPVLDITGARRERDAGWYQLEAINQTGSTFSSIAFVNVVTERASIIAWGDSSLGATTVPTGLASVASISSGFAHTLVLKGDGKVSAWGSNVYGQSTVPTGLSGVVAVSAGGGHSLALLGSGKVVGWGLNHMGQATAPANLTGVVAIAAGDSHSLALKSDGTVVAWGINNAGQSTVPTGLSGVVGIAAGYSHSLAWRSDGTSVAWGEKTWDNVIPEKLTGVASMDGGGQFTLALKGDGSVAAWGRNTAGQINVPAGLVGVTAVQAGDAHVIALKSDGTVVTWGSNALGQSTLPANAKGVRGVSAGYAFSTALLGAPQITSPAPTTFTVMRGDRIQIEVEATGAEPLRYQWYQGESGTTTAPVAGATGAILLSPALTESANFWVRIVDGYGGSVDGPTVAAIVPTIDSVAPDPVMPEGAVAFGTTGLPARDTLKMKIGGVELTGLTRNVLLYDGFDRIGALTGSSPLFGVPVASWTQAGANVTDSLLKMDGSALIFPGDGSSSDDREPSLDFALPANAVTRISARVSVVGGAWNGSTFSGWLGLGLMNNAVANPEIFTSSGPMIGLSGDGTIWTQASHNGTPTNFRTYQPSLGATKVDLAIEIDNRTQQATTVGFYANGTLLSSHTYGPGGFAADHVFLRSYLASGGSVEDFRITSSAATGVVGIVPKSVPVGTQSLTILDGDAVIAARQVQVLGTPPSIAAQPSGLTLLMGQSGTLSVTANGTAPLSYQWRKDGVAINGATSASYSIASAKATDAGSYSVVVSNAAGSVTSAAVTVSVSSPTVAPSIATQPTGLTLTVGQSGTLSVTANGTAPLSYQWRKDGVAISGATGASLALSSVTTAAAGSYTVVVSNAAGSATSAAVVVTVSPAGNAPTITRQPTSQRVAAGSTVTFAAEANGTGALSYQWNRNGTAISGATGASLTLSRIQSADVGVYTVAVRNSVGTVTSDGASLEVAPAGVVVTATQAVSGNEYRAGQTVTVTNTLSYGSGVSGLAWQLILPNGWSYVSGSGAEGDIKPVVGTTELLEWAWSSTPASPATFTVTLSVPASETGTKALSALVISRTNGTANTEIVNPTPLNLSSAPTLHSADTNRDRRISLLELTRVIELYNTRSGSVRTGQYTELAGSEDGFTAGSAGTLLTRYHTADSNNDGRISLLELTRVIELYNYRQGTVRTGQYRPQSGTEDGFAPGP